MAQNILMHAWDAVTKRLREVEWVGGAAKVYIASLFAGENQALNALETIPANEYRAGAAVTNAADITLGAVGAAGDYCDEILVRNDGAAGNTGVLTVEVKDSTTLIDALKTTIAEGASATLRIRAKSVNGAWKLKITAAVAGGIANAKYAATGLFS